MVNKPRRRVWIQLSLLLTVVFVIISLYFFMLLSMNKNYLGISARKEGASWVIKKIQVNGAANSSGIKIGDKLEKIDGQPAGDNRVLNKWLIVEQADTIAISREGKMHFITFTKNKLNVESYCTFFVIGFIYLIILIGLSRKQLKNKRSRQFYRFSVLSIFSLLAVVPSSMGNYLGRLIIVFAISAFPGYVYIFLNKSSSINSYRIRLLQVIVLIGLVNVSLISLAYFIQLPSFFSEYLSTGVFYVLGLILFSLFASELFKGFSSYKEKKEGTRIDLSLISLLSFVPLFLFYILPTGWVAPFYLVVLFIVLPAFGIAHLLILSRFLRYNYKMNQSVLYFILAFILSATITIISLLGRYVPLLVLMLYVFFLIYSFFPLIGEMILTVKRKKDYSDPVALFVAVEDERENISTFIHDTVIQDVIYLMKTAEEKEENISKETIIQELDELIFHLRELCSDIYPLMIQEMGLTNTIASMIDQTVKQHTVNISYTIDKKVENFPVKINNFILRSLKEFINNSILHGKADEITLTISYKENNCFFEVVDNGNYTQKKNDGRVHFGLSLIKEKLTLLGGELHVDISGQTTITMMLPYNQAGGERR